MMYPLTMLLAFVLFFMLPLVPTICSAEPQPVGAIFIRNGKNVANSDVIIKRDALDIKLKGIKAEVLPGDEVWLRKGVHVQYEPYIDGCTGTVMYQTFKIDPRGNCAIKVLKAEGQWEEIETLFGGPFCEKKVFSDTLINRGPNYAALHSMLLRPLVIFVQEKNSAKPLKDLDWDETLGLRDHFRLTENIEEADVIVAVSPLNANDNSVDDYRVSIVTAALPKWPIHLNNEFLLNSSHERRRFIATMLRLANYNGLSKICHPGEYSSKCGEGTGFPLKVILDYWAEYSDHCDGCSKAGGKFWKKTGHSTIINNGKLASTTIDKAYSLNFAIENLSNQDYYLYIISIKNNGKVSLIFPFENRQIAHQKIPAEATFHLNKRWWLIETYEQLWMIASIHPIDISPYIQTAIVPDSNTAPELVRNNNPPILLPSDYFISGISFKRIN